MFLSRRHSNDSQHMDSKLSQLIDSAVKQTLTTIKFSSNRHPETERLTNGPRPKSWLFNPNSPNARESFITNRSLCHLSHEGHLLASTHHKNAKNKWQEVYAKVDGRMNLDHTPSEALALSFSEFNLVVQVSYARNERSGNCGVAARTLLYYLWKAALASNTKAIERLETIGFESPSHIIVVINRKANSNLQDPSSWGGIIVDAWNGLVNHPRVFSSSAFPAYLAHLKNERSDIFLTASVKIKAAMSDYEVTDLENSLPTFEKLEKLIMKTPSTPLIPLPKSLSTEEKQRKAFTEVSKQLHKFSFQTQAKQRRVTNPGFVRQSIYKTSCPLNRVIGYN